MRETRRPHHQFRATAPNRGDPNERSQAGIQRTGARILLRQIGGRDRRVERHRARRRARVRRARRAGRAARTPSRATRRARDENQQGRRQGARTRLRRDRSRTRVLGDRTGQGSLRQSRHPDQLGGPADRGDGREHAPRRSRKDDGGECLRRAQRDAGGAAGDAQGQVGQHREHLVAGRDAAASARSAATARPSLRWSG